MDMGALRGLVYSKDTEGQRTYIHFMDDPPQLMCDADGRQLYVLGGSYRITQRGSRLAIVESRRGSVAKDSANAQQTKLRRSDDRQSHQTVPSGVRLCDSIQHPARGVLRGSTRALLAITATPEAYGA